MDNTYLRITIRSLIVIIGMIACFFATILILRYLYPFIFAFILAFFLDKIVTALEVRFNISRSLTTIILLVFIIASFSLFGVFIFLYVLEELVVIFKGMTSYVEQVTVFFQQLIDMLTSFFQMDKFNRVDITDYLQDVLLGASSYLTNFFNLFLTTFTQTITSFSNFITVAIFTGISLFFMTKDMPFIKESLKNFLPKEVIYYSTLMTRELRRSFTGFIKGQLIIASMTFIIILVGLILFQIEHGLTIALFSFLIDFLPYLGVGLIFLPWIVYVFFMKSYSLAIKLSIIYMCVIIARQLLEPKIIADSIGINPLIALIILFISLQLFGISGFLLSPLILILISAFYHAKVFAKIVDFVKADE